MNRSRLSLFYLAGYLLTTGVAFLVFPQESLRLLRATGHYENPFVQFVGAFMVALGTLVAQMIRFRLEILYRTTVMIRLFFIAVILWLHHSTGDPMFLMILGVVVLGVCLTLTGLVLDHRSSRDRHDLLTGS